MHFFTLPSPPHLASLYGFQFLLFMETKDKRSDSYVNVEKSFIKKERAV